MLQTVLVLLEQQVAVTVRMAVKLTYTPRPWAPPVLQCNEWVAAGTICTQDIMTSERCRLQQPTSSFTVK
jgi:hypothetical protein